MLRSYSPSTGTWTAARNIGNVGLNYPSMVMAPDGTITLAWQEEWLQLFQCLGHGGHGGRDLDHAYATRDRQPGDPNRQYGSYYEPLPFPALAVDGDGNVLAFWNKKTQTTPLEFAVYSRRKLAGKPNGVWQPATELARKSELRPTGRRWPSVTMAWVQAGYFWKDPESTNDPDAYQVFVSLFR
jgi:hypothetical protein